MRLVDLHPRWVGHGGDGVYDGQTGEKVPYQAGIGVSFDCPCGCGDRVFVTFKNPLQSGNYEKEYKGPMWNRTGDNFEDLTLKPSILRKGGCGWHGFIEDGFIRTV